MEFVTLLEKEFRQFADKHPDKSFFQTPEIAHLRQQNGWIPYYFGVKQNRKIVAATMVVAKPTFLGKSTFYAPGGPLVDYEDAKLLTFFVKNLKNYMKHHNGYVFHIDPYYELIQRDRDGKVVSGGFDHTKAALNLKSLGFKPLPISEQPKYLFILDLNGHTPDELFASFKQNTRNLISRTSRNGVKVRELEREELPVFKAITEATSERRHFTDKTLRYYEQMYDLFHDKGEVKFIVAEVSEDTLSRSVFGDGPNMERPSPVTTGARERSEKDVSLIPLSAAMFMTYGDEVLYLFSGSDKKYMKEYNAQYAIQWHMIKYAAEHGFKRYNFYGIQGLPDPKSPGYGIYKFKKGFGGRVVELLGSYELPLSSLYYLHSFLSKLRHH